MMFFDILLCLNVHDVSHLTLQTLLEWAKRIESIEFKNRRTGNTKRTLPFKEGWIITLRSLSLMIIDLLSREETLFILTRRLNQDPLEVRQSS